MTRFEFEKQVKPLVKHGYDGIDGNDIWKEFREALTELLDSERQHYSTVAGNIRCTYGDDHEHCECAFQAKKAIENDAH